MDGSRINPRWIQDGSRMDRAWIEDASRMDQGWIGDGSGMDRGWIEDGSRMDPGWIEDGSRSGNKANRSTTNKELCNHFEREPTIERPCLQNSALLGLRVGVAEIRLSPRGNFHTQMFIRPWVLK